MIALKSISTICFCILINSLLMGQAWTKEKGHSFLKLDFSNISSNRYFDQDANIVEIEPIRFSTYSFYGEYGITDKISAIAYVPYVHNTFTDSNISNGGIGDIDLALRFALPVKKVDVALNILFGLPTGNGMADLDLNTGDGEFNQMLKLGVGTAKNKWWVQTAIGYNNRTQNFSDEFRYDLEFGYKFFNDRLMVMLKLNGVESLKNGTKEENTTGLFSNNVAYSGVGPEILYFVTKKKNVGLTCRFAGAFSGKYVLAAPSAAIGFFGDF